MHLDRLSALDSSFLHQEDEAAHMHLGGVLVCEGPPPPIGELLEHVRRRLDLVPRYRQKLATPPGGAGREYWVDDPDFNLTYHVRHTALPAPGGDEQLRRLAARVFGQTLDRTKPLWELFVVEGMTGDRFALISKTHHALVDGETSLDLLTIAFDPTTTPAPQPRTTWTPHPSPSAAQLASVGSAWDGRLRRIARIAERLGRLKGRAIVSLNDTPGVRETFAAFRMEEAELPYTIGQASGGVKEAKEVLIYTFDRPALPLFG